MWQEGHTAHLHKKDADKEVLDILDLYRGVYEELLAVPVTPGVKSEKEKFAGGLYTTTVEGFIPTSGRGIQGGTSHSLGQNFSKMFNIVVEDPSKASNSQAAQTPKLHVWQNSWGLSTRTIGVMVMVHGDDKGLVLPPRVAQIQVVIVPVGITASSTAEQREQIYDKVDEVAKTLRSAGVKARADLRDGYTPGWKFNDWEMKGVPLRLELGPKDIAKQSTLAVRRDDSSKFPLPLASLAKDVLELLEKIQKDMYDRAKKVYDERRRVIRDWKDFVPALNSNCSCVIPWCEQEACEDNIKEQSAKECARFLLIANAADRRRAGPRSSKTRRRPLQAPNRSASRSIKTSGGPLSRARSASGTSARPRRSGGVCSAGRIRCSRCSRAGNGAGSSVEVGKEHCRWSMEI